jgi:hypothetical protein
VNQNSGHSPQRRTKTWHGGDGERSGARSRSLWRTDTAGAGAGESGGEGDGRGGDGLGGKGGGFGFAAGRVKKTEDALELD